MKYLIPSLKNLILKYFTKVLIMFLCFSFDYSFGQSISLNELFNLCKKTNWTQVNEHLTNNGWDYYESSKGDDTEYSTITWSYKKEYYEEKAKGWFYIYTYDGLPNKIVYTCFNKSSFSQIKNGIASANLKLTGNTIEEDNIISNYENSSYIVSIRTSRQEDDSEYENSAITAYTTVVILKRGIYDVNNGIKKIFDDEGNLSSEITLKDGQYNGVSKLFYKNGKIKIESYYINDRRNGQSKEYDEDGNLSGVYTYKDDELIGPYKIYKEGRLFMSGNLKYGVKDGQFIQYNDDNKINMEYTMLDNKLNGNYKEYIYNENKLTFKIIGEYYNDLKNGHWVTLKYEKDKYNVIEYFDYRNGIKDGPFREVKGDTIIFGTYKNELLTGDYKEYINISDWLFGTISGDTNNAVLMTSGFYILGKKNSYWKFYSLTSSLIKEGAYFNDLEDGEWKYYFEKMTELKNKPLPYSEKLFLIENYLNGKKNGKEVRYWYVEEKQIPCDTTGNKNANPLDTCTTSIYHSTNEIAYYKNDVLHGPFEVKDSNNITTFKGNYINGIKEGIWLETYFNDNSESDNSYVFVKGNYENNLQQGKWVEFKKENFIIREYNFVNGELNGKVTSFNKYNKPEEEKYFEFGKLKSVYLYDSIGNIVLIKYELFEETNSQIKCKVTEFLNNQIVSQVYTILTGDDNKINYRYFPLYFSLITGEKGDGKYGYKDGEYKLYDKIFTLQTEGYYLKRMQVGNWKYYFNDSDVYFEQIYTNNIGSTPIFYYNKSNKLFDGKLVLKYPNGKTQFMFKIADGLRNGKSIYYDENGDVIKEEKYENGILK